MSPAGLAFCNGSLGGGTSIRTLCEPWLLVLSVLVFASAASQPSVPPKYMSHTLHQHLLWAPIVLIPCDHSLPGVGQEGLSDFHSGSSMVTSSQRTSFGCRVVRPRKRPQSKAQMDGRYSLTSAAVRHSAPCIQAENLSAPVTRSGRMAGRGPSQLQRSSTLEGKWQTIRSDMYSLGSDHWRHQPVPTASAGLGENV